MGSLAFGFTLLLVDAGIWVWTLAIATALLWPATWHAPSALHLTSRDLQRFFEPN